jgi:RNA polymerase primary sigma factor
VSLELAHKLGAMPSRREIAEAIDMPLDELDSLLRQALTTSSLDAPVSGEEGRSFLGDLIADNSTEEPLDQVERGIHQEQLGRWLSQLTEQEQEVLQLRFGLNGEERHTLAEIGRRLDVSRERVRQVELKALRKLRNLTRRQPPGL